MKILKKPKTNELGLKEILQHMVTCSIKGMSRKTIDKITAEIEVPPFWYNVSFLLVCFFSLTFLFSTEKALPN